MLNKKILKSFSIVYYLLLTFTVFGFKVHYKWWWRYTMKDNFISPIYCFVECMYYEYKRFLGCRYHLAAPNLPLQESNIFQMNPNDFHQKLMILILTLEFIDIFFGFVLEYPHGKQKIMLFNWKFHFCIFHGRKFLFSI